MAIVYIRVSNESSLEQYEGNKEEQDGVYLGRLPVKVDQILNSFRAEYSNMITIREFSK